ncbi:MAG: GGDEF domain-containing protein [Planctomycetota bacterium]
MVFGLGAPSPLLDTLNPAPHRILVCDHAEPGLDLELLEQLGDRSLAVERQTTLRHSVETLRAGEPALIVLHSLLPRSDLELRLIDEHRRRDAPTPLLIVTQRGDVEGILRPHRVLQDPYWETIDATAPLEEWIVRIKRALALAHERSEVEELRHRAAHDDRTDLLRPTAFQTRLVEHFSAAQRHKLDLALVLIDLDRFGQINKQHSHTVGDYLISRVGEVIRRALRTEDVAGRLGGDEFGVLLPYTGKADSAQVVRRLGEALRQLSGRAPGANGELDVSASIGFETFDGSDIDSLETLREHAERALRSAKRAGGDRGVYYRLMEVAAGE